MENNKHNCVEFPRSEDDRSWMNVEGIWEFSQLADLADVQKLLDKEIACNMAISRDALAGTA